MTFTPRGASFVFTQPELQRCCCLLEGKCIVQSVLVYLSGAIIKMLDVNVFPQAPSSPDSFHKSIPMGKFPFVPFQSAGLHPLFQCIKIHVHL